VLGNSPPLPALQSKERSLKNFTTPLLGAWPRCAKQSIEHSLKNSIYCSEHICSPPRKAKLLLSRKILSALRGTAEPSKSKMLEKLRKLYDSLPSAAVQSKAF
jgi:hypothetical protein